MHPVLQVVLSVWPFTNGFLIPVQSAFIIALQNVLGPNSLAWGVFFNHSVIFTVSLCLCFQGPPLSKAFENLRAAVRKDKWELVSCVGGLLSITSIFLGAFVSDQIDFGPAFLVIACGMISLSLLLDWKGWMWATKRKIRVLDLVGAGMTILGTGVFTVTGALRETTKHYSAVSAASFALAFVSGCIFTAQGAVNKRLAHTLGNTFRSSFWAGATGVCILLPIAFGSQPNPCFQCARPSDSWKFMVGVIGLALLLSNMTVPRFLGFSLAAKARVCGNIVGAVILDQFLYELTGKRKAPSPTPVQIAGLVLALLGLIIAIRPPPKVGTERKAVTGGGEETGTGEEEGEHRSSLSEKGLATSHQTEGGNMVGEPSDLEVGGEGEREGEGEGQIQTQTEK
uniref:EamA domain-containing protein n=1 Tax=Chromera velia CCMP2878 TaxID=1169474 RepID=A0A0G4GQ86_9ALVE|eukprot:Cvel_22896.t1-p1 / transcript=Cvel_22896.t1 / gene=Cvel_22896 / organism=Chromera_velia_CCMP2878 / gene_product=hypothetical protein / transcript_product=hypothetical protein / location=Cvel_scaffold2300:14316-16358(+) / protein_length=396 / sequence_SO=supercontig / SO=protein_coding / is_pseudo=false